MHGVKLASHYDLALQRWTTGRTSDHLTLRCDRNCSAHGVEAFSWEWARLPCKPRTWSDPRGGTGRFCAVEPSAHYRCCSWPWVVPQVRTAILRALSAAPGQRMRVHALVLAARREAAAASRGGKLPRPPGKASRAHPRPAPGRATGHARLFLFFSSYDTHQSTRNYTLQRPYNQQVQKGLHDSDYKTTRRKE